MTKSLVTGGKSGLKGRGELAGGGLGSKKRGPAASDLLFKAILKLLSSSFSLYSS